jgi:hypothetical protein
MTNKEGHHKLKQSEWKESLKTCLGLRPRPHHTTANVPQPGNGDKSDFDDSQSGPFSATGNNFPGPSLRLIRDKY